MKVTTVFLASILFTHLSHAASLWIVGEKYIGYWDGENSPTYFDAIPTSWGLNESTCELWYTESDHRLFKTRSANAPQKIGEANRILTPTFSKQVGLLSVENKLEIRNSKGALESTFQHIPGMSHTLDITGKDSSLLVYDREQNLLLIQKLNADFTLANETPIHTKGYLWSEPKMVRDVAREKTWIGYTAEQGGYLYTPIVKQMDNELNIEHEFRWNVRGLFYDSCLQADGSLLIARDLPSNSGFTVPVYSFIEHLEGKINKGPIHTASTNLFIDSMICQKDQIWMLQRSIFGSDGSHLQVWPRKSEGIGEKVFNLPGRAWKIYGCGV